MGWQRERINTRLFRLLRRRGRRGHISLFDVSLYSSLVRDGGRIGSCNRDYPAHRVVIVRLRLTLDSRCPYNRFSAKYPTCALISSLPPRSTAGQLTLDQHIGVRIPGGQPVYYQALTSPDFPQKRPVVTVSGNFRFANPAERRCMPRNNPGAALRGCCDLSCKRSAEAAFDGTGDPWENTHHERYQTPQAAARSALALQLAVHLV